ncbi:MAG TPA: alginate lyase family protein [Planctomycetota bacterium]
MPSFAELRLSLALVALASGPQTAVREGTWISPQEIAPLPTEGPAWGALRAAASAPLGAPDLSAPDDDTDVLVLARALVYARTGDEHCRAEVLVALATVIGSERGGTVLALARNLPGYVIAAELVAPSAALECRFRAWLSCLVELPLRGGTLRSVHERRPNNWGTHAGAARAVIARHLGDARELARCAQVFRGWLGERSAHDGFVFGDRAWQADPTRPLAVNPRGATRDGHSLDGVLPDDQRRGGGFTWPPPRENYVYEALQGALLQAMVLSRAGYPAWEWGERALLRAALWLAREADYPAEGDDTWQPHVLNHVYGTRLRAPLPARPGKSVGWTDWTLAGTRDEGD